MPGVMLERVAVREPETSAQHRLSGHTGHGYEVTMERLQLWAEPRKCLKVTVIWDQVTLLSRGVLDT